MTDNVVPLPPRLVRTDEPFVPEPAVFAGTNDEWARENLPGIRQAVAIVGMRPDQVRAFVAIIDGTAEPAADLAAELERLAGHLGALKDAVENARQRLAWAAAQKPL